MAAHASPEEYFKQIKSRARIRHGTLFLLEPTFILADMLADAEGRLPADVVKYLDRLVQHAKTVTPAPTELPAEDDQRYRAKLALFEKILVKWIGEEAKAVEIDGSGWENGWGDWMTISCEMV
jgi:hypothetical protein